MLRDLHERIRDVRQGPDGLLYFVTDNPREPPAPPASRALIFSSAGLTSQRRPADRLRPGLTLSPSVEDEEGAGGDEREADGVVPGERLLAGTSTEKPAKTTSVTTSWIVFSSAAA